MCFNKWLAVQSDRDDPTGDIAKLCAGKQFPARTFEQFAVWVAGQEKELGAGCAAESAWCEYHYGAVKTERALKKIHRAHVARLKAIFLETRAALTPDEIQFIKQQAHRFIPGELLTLLDPNTDPQLGEKIGRRICARFVKNLFMFWTRRLVAWVTSKLARTQGRNAIQDVVRVES
jgi:hypothetical protein